MGFRGEPCAISYAWHACMAMTALQETHVHWLLYTHHGQIKSLLCDTDRIGQLVKLLQRPSREKVNAEWKQELKTDWDTMRWTHGRFAPWQPDCSYTDSNIFACRLVLMIMTSWHPPRHHNYNVNQVRSPWIMVQHTCTYWLHTVQYLFFICSVPWVWIMFFWVWDKELAC